MYSSFNNPCMYAGVYGWKNVFVVEGGHFLDDRQGSKRGFWCSPCSSVSGTFQIFPALHVWSSLELLWPQAGLCVPETVIWEGLKKMDNTEAEPGPQLSQNSKKSEMGTGISVRSLLTFCLCLEDGIVHYFLCCVGSVLKTLFSTQSFPMLYFFLTGHVTSWNFITIWASLIWNPSCSKIWNFGVRFNTTMRKSQYHETVSHTNYFKHCIWSPSDYCVSVYIRYVWNMNEFYV